MRTLCVVPAPGEDRVLTALATISDSTARVVRGTGHGRLAGSVPDGAALAEAKCDVRRRRP